MVGDDGKKTLRALEAAGSQQGKPTEPLTMVRTWVTVKPKAKAPKDESGG